MSNVILFQYQSESQSGLRLSLFISRNEYLPFTVPGRVEGRSAVRLLSLLRNLPDVVDHLHRVHRRYVQ